ncbi:URAD decarboxylase, partial [Amia calva]|nr:URAD decarboxylase [Amia calva]
DMDMRQVNSLSYEEFVETFGNVVERCPVVAAAVWSGRPFANSHDLEASIGEFIDSLPVAGQEGIVRCHPDLAGRDLKRGALTAESRGEQTQAGLTLLDAGDAACMNRLNAQYKERFGFPFVICARMNNKEEILLRLAERLGNEPAQERQCAIEEVKKICQLRLQDIIQCPATHTKL